MKILNVVLNLDPKDRNFGIDVFHGIRSQQVSEQVLIDKEKEKVIDNLHNSEHYYSPIKYYEYNNVITFNPAIGTSIETSFKDNYKLKYHKPLNSKFIITKNNNRLLSDFFVPDLNLYLGLLYKIDSRDIGNSDNHDKPIPTNYFNLYFKKNDIKNKNFNDDSLRCKFKRNPPTDLMTFVSANPVKVSDTQATFDEISITEFNITDIRFKQEISYNKISISNSSSVDAINTSLTRFSTKLDENSSSKVITIKKNYGIEVFKESFEELDVIIKANRLGSRKHPTNLKIRKKLRDLNYNKNFFRRESDNFYLSPYNDTFIFSFLEKVEDKNLDLALILNKFSFREFTNNNLSFITLSEDFRKIHIENIQKEIMLYYASKNTEINDDEISDYLFAYVYLLNEKINKGESYIEDLLKESDSIIELIKLRIRNMQYYRIKRPKKINQLLSFTLQRSIPNRERSSTNDNLTYENLIDFKSMLNDPNVKIYVDKLYKVLFYYKDMSDKVSHKTLNEILDTSAYNVDLEKVLYEEFNNVINIDPIT